LKGTEGTKKSSGGEKKANGSDDVGIFGISGFGFWAWVSTADGVIFRSGSALLLPPADAVPNSVERSVRE
jgi:hypothetical protein